MPTKKSTQKTPLSASRVSAGFPSPADDQIEEHIDLNELLITNKPATYMIRVSGDSMRGAGILEGDILIVDASKKPRSGQIVVASVDGDFLVKRLILEKSKTILKAENPSFVSLEIKPDNEFSIFGVVTGVVRQM